MSFYITKTYCSQQNFYSQSWGVRKSKCFLIYDSIFLQIRMISLTKIGLLYTIKIFVIEQRQININREKEKVMTITKNVLNLMIFFLTYKRSLAQTANSQQPTALLSKNNIQYFNNIFNETERFRIFSDRSFFMSFWCFDRSARCLLK